MTTNQQTGLRLPSDVRAWLRQKAVDLDTTLTQVVTDVVRERIAAETPPQVCPVCQGVRHLSPDLVFTALEHAQCDQRLAELDAGAEVSS